MFWSELGDRLRSAGDEDAEGMSGLRILQAVVTQLIALSRTKVVNIRDSITEAVLSLALRCQVGRVEITTRITVLKRQINAEEAKVRTSSQEADDAVLAKLSSQPRYRALNKQLGRCQEVCYYSERFISYCPE